MAYRFAIELPGAPRVEVLSALIEAATVSNTAWYLDQWRAGADPPCCAGCADLLWRPDVLDVESLLVALPHAFARDSASCHTAAAISAGHERAADIRKGLSWNHAAARHRVELRETGPRTWHAYLLTNGRIVDPTEEMKRA